jgi:hypothetical protein
VVQVGEDKEAMQRLMQLKFKHKQERKQAEQAKQTAKDNKNQQLIGASSSKDQKGGGK